jgi:Pentapeptide repeats (8 copies)
VVGIALVTRRGERKRQAGASIITGALVACALAAVQAWAESRRDADARRNQFRFTVAVTKHLEGLDPRAVDPSLSLDGMHLSGRILDDSKLAGVNLRNATLEDASLVGADLRRAHLERANLYHADLSRAKLADVHLEGADLRRAKLGAVLYPHGGIAPRLFLSRATKVDPGTCWPAAFLASRLAKRLRAPLKPEPLTIQGVTQPVKPSIGRACVLTVDEIGDMLGLYSKRGHGIRRIGQTVHRVARTFGVPDARVAKKLSTVTRTRATPGPLGIKPRACAGARRLSVDLTGDWKQGRSFLLVGDGQQVSGTTWADELSAPDTQARKDVVKVLLNRPLRAGESLQLTGTTAERVNRLAYRQSVRVKAC